MRRIAGNGAVNLPTTCIFMYIVIVFGCINVTLSQSSFLSHSSTVHVALVVSCQAPMLTVCEGTEQTGIIGA